MSTKLREVWSQYRGRILALVAALVLSITGVAVIATDSDHDGIPDTVTVTITKKQTVTSGTLTVPLASQVDTGTATRAPDSTVAASKAEQQEVVDNADHGDLRDQTPDGVSDQDLDAAQDQQEQLARNDNLPVVSPDAAPTQAGCRSNFVQNYSSRGGVKPRLLVMHYTVSSNRPGWDDVNAIVNLFNTWSYRASSNFVYDYEGNCAYIVRTSDKAWTQATFNPVSISWEVIANGSEGHFVQGAALKKLGRIVADQAKLWGIPLQRGQVSGCVVTRPGIVMHKDLGACGGGHVDITPYALEPIIKAAQAAGRPKPKPATDAPAKVVAWCGRAHDLHDGHGAERRQLARREGYRCADGKPYVLKG